MSSHESYESGVGPLVAFDAGGFTDPDALAARRARGTTQASGDDDRFYVFDSRVFDGDEVEMRADFDDEDSAWLGIWRVTFEDDEWRVRPRAEAK